MIDGMTLQVGSIFSTVHSIATPLVICMTFKAAGKPGQTQATACVKIGREERHTLLQ